MLFDGPDSYCNYEESKISRVQLFKAITVIIDQPSNDIASPQ